MAINKESNGFTFGFAIALVAVVGTVLALLAMGLETNEG
jgi:Na+-transporting NADH:ubiquinone oxidoreductase subunit C